MKRLAIAAALVLLVSAPARAAVIFSDNFDSENGGVWALNYTGFANFVVSGGTVDLIGVGSPYDFLPGNGLYIDMDGSTFNAGIMTANPLALGPGDYVLSFDVAGSHRGDPSVFDDMQVKVFGGLNPLYASVYYLVQSSVPFTNVTMSFTLGAPDLIRFSFEGIGTDNIGVLLDDVTVSSVPEPATGLLLLLGLVAARRRSVART